EDGNTEAALDLRLVRFMTAGGDSGPSIVPGDAQGSYLFQRIRDGEMPPGELHKLTPEQIDTVRRWIDAGAPTLRPEPQEVDGYLITEEERSHWSFQPIKRPPLPAVQHPERVRTPIDNFVLDRLETEGFT